MEKQQSPNLHSQCCCCMTENDEIRLQIHVINSEALRHIFQRDQLKLCYICKKVAERADQFVQNVQKNQPFFDGVEIENRLETRFESVQPIYNLTQLISDVLELKMEIGNEELFVKKEELDSTDLDTEMNDSGNLNSTSFTEQNDEANNESNKSELIELHEILQPLERGGGNSIILELLTRGYNNESGVYNNETHRESPNEEILDDGVIETLNKVVCQLGDQEVDDEFLYPEEARQEEKPVKVPKPDVFYVTIEECKKERDAKALTSSYARAPFKCKHCILGFRMKASLDTHMNKHRDEGEFECDICNLHFPTPAKLQTHIPNHTRRYKCSACDYTSRSTVETKDHYFKVHCNGARAYTCPYCNEKSTTYKNHRYHLLKHKTMLKCPYCVGLFRSGTTLNGHMRRKHPEEVGYKPVPPKKSYVCDECGREMTTENGLYKHKKLHVKKNERKEFLCVECNRSFETETGLRCHLKYTKLHSYALICDYCNEEFSSRTRLITHIKCHMGLFKEVKCEICNQGFRDKMNMKQHVRRKHHGFRSPRDKFCPICNKGFQEVNQVKIHLRVHTGEKPFTCDKCPATFAQNGALYYHNKLVHLGLRKDGTAKTKTRKKRE